MAYEMTEERRAALVRLSVHMNVTFDNISLSLQYLFQFPDTVNRFFGFLIQTFGVNL